MYRYLEHTADELLEAQAPTFAQALKDAVEGSFELIGKGKREEAKLEIEAAAETKEDLVVEILQETVVGCELNGLSPSRAELIELNEEAPHAKFRIICEKKPPRNQIKAVTYHLLKVENENGKWRINVLFDV
ncbi:archease [Candidatus Micrarchaeota archaeon]|nr:archease [Candidatus Micrarchaeota archaeon]